MSQNASNHVPGHDIQLGRRKYTSPAKEVIFPAATFHSSSNPDRIFYPKQLRIAFFIRNGFDRKFYPTGFLANYVRQDFLFKTVSDSQSYPTGFLFREIYMSLRNFCLLLFLFYLQLVWAWCEFDLHNQCLYNTLSKSNNFRICFHFFCQRSCHHNMMIGVFFQNLTQNLSAQNMVKRGVPEMIINIRSIGTPVKS